VSPFRGLFPLEGILTFRVVDRAPAGALMISAKDVSVDPRRPAPSPPLVVGLVT